MPARIGELRVLPGPNAKEILASAEQYCVTTVQNHQLVISDHLAHGAILYDIDNNVYLDFFSGAGVNNFGYGVSLFAKAAKGQIDRGVAVYDFSVFANPCGVLLCRELSELAPGNVARKVFLANSGTEAVEAAIKIAQAARPGRKHWVSFDGAFHGRTLGSLSFNASKPAHKLGFSTAFEPLSFPFPSREGALDGLFERVNSYIMPSDIVAVIVELVQGEGGVNIANHHELARLNRFCEKYGIIRIVDEVQTGIARTGTLFALEQFPEFHADIITMAKALGGGLPVSATIIDARLDFSYAGRHANTMGGNMVGAKTALAVLHYCKTHPEIFKHVQDTGLYLRRRLSELQQHFSDSCERARSTSKLYCAPRLFNTRGLGLMCAADLEYPRWLRCTHDLSVDPRKFLESACLERGLIVCSSGRHGIRFLPPLTIERADVDKAVEIFEEALYSAFS